MFILRLVRLELVVLVFSSVWVERDSFFFGRKGLWSEEGWSWFLGVDGNWGNRYGGGFGLVYI